MFYKRFYNPEQQLINLLKSKNVNRIKRFINDIKSNGFNNVVTSKSYILKLALDVNVENDEIFFLLFNFIMVIDKATVLSLLNLRRHQIKIGDSDFLKYLFHNSKSNFVDLLEEDENGETIFHYAFRNLKIKPIKFLLNFYFINSLADPNREGNIIKLYYIFLSNLNILLSFNVSIFDIISICKVFVNNGIDINTENSYTNSFIQKVLSNETYSTENKQTLIKFALSQNQDIFLMDKSSGKTVFFTAILNDIYFHDIFFANDSVITQLKNKNLELYLYLYYKEKLMCIDLYENKVNSNDDKIHQILSDIITKVDELLANHSIIEIIKQNSKANIDVDILLTLSIIYYPNNNPIINDFLNNPLQFQKLKSNNDWYAFHYACKYERIDIIQSFLKIKANINFRNRQNETPLSIASNIENMEIVSLLFERPSIINKEDINTVLLSACKEGKYNLVKVLLSHNADINTEDNQKRTPLIIACSNNDIEMAKILLDAKANTEKKDNNGNSALIIACHNVNIPLMEELINRHANVNIFDDKRRTPLIWACLKKNIELVRFLLKYPVDINYKCFNGNTPLIIACFNHQLEIVIELLNQKGIQINLVNQRKNTPLITAAECGDISIVKELLNRKASIDERNKSGNTALMASLEKDQNEVAELLLDNNASVTIKNKNGETALFIACKNNNKKIIEKLVECKNVDVNGSHSNLKSVLMQACENQNLEIVEFLIQHNADINKPYGMWNETAFMTVCKNDNIDIMNLLLNLNPNYNLTSWYGKNSLMYLCENGLTRQVEMIIDKIKDINTRDRNNNTAFSLACSNNHISCMELLMKYGAENDTQNNDGNTPLHLACINGNIDIIEMLLCIPVRVNLLNKEGNTPLLIASQKQNDDKTFETLIHLNSNIDFSLMNNKGESALDILINNKSTKKLELLVNYDLEKRYLEKNIEIFIDNKFNCNESLDISDDIMDIVKLLFKYLSYNKNYKFTDNLLLAFVKIDYTEAAEYVLKHQQCNINYIDQVSGSSLLMTAVLNNNYSIVKYLLENGAYINQSDSQNGNTILMISSIYGFDKIMNCILLHNPEINDMNNMGETALILAVKNNNSRCTELLLLNYADPNLPDSTGDSPLFYACKNNNIRLVDLLLKHNANSHIKNSQGQTPLMISSINGNDEIVKLLLKYNVNINEMDNDLNTALILACEYKNYEVINTLLYFSADTQMTNRHNYTAYDYIKRDKKIKELFDSYMK